MAGIPSNFMEATTVCLKICKNNFDRSVDAENIRYKGFATKGRTRFEKTQKMTIGR